MRRSHLRALVWSKQQEWESRGGWAWAKHISSSSFCSQHHLLCFAHLLCILWILLLFCEARLGEARRGSVRTWKPSHFINWCHTFPFILLSISLSLKLCSGGGEEKQRKRKEVIGAERVLHRSPSSLLVLKTTRTMPPFQSTSLQEPQEVQCNSEPRKLKRKASQLCGVAELTQQWLPMMACDHIALSF